jgi:hypothetical protein
MVGIRLFGSRPMWTGFGTSRYAVSLPPAEIGVLAIHPGFGMARVHWF